MHMNLPDKDSDSRYVMAGEDARDYPTQAKCALDQHCVPASLCHLSMKANTCDEFVLGIV